MQKLTIDRQKWIRGESDSYLFRDWDQKMCCLGFLAIFLGAKETDILYSETPEQAINVNWSEKLCVKKAYNTFLCNDIIFTNDDKDKNDQEREKLLKEKFAEIDIDVEFIN